MSSPTTDHRSKRAGTLALADERAIAHRGLEDQPNVIPARRFAKQRRRSRRADLLIRVQQLLPADLPSQRRTLERTQRREHDENPTLGVDHARPAADIAVDACALKWVVRAKDCV